MGRRAPGRHSHRRGLRYLSREEDEREVGAFGHVDFMHGVSRGPDPGRYDNLEPGDAKGTNLLCLPRARQCLAVYQGLVISQLTWGAGLNPPA